MPVGGDVTIQPKFLSLKPKKFLTGFLLNFFKIQPVFDFARNIALFTPGGLLLQHSGAGAHPLAYNF
jgi:hypothetical protein